MSIKLTSPILVAGAHVPVDGATLSYAADFEADLVNRNMAVYVSNPARGGMVPVTSTFNPVTGGIDFSGKLAGNLATGKWFNPPSIFRLLLNGTGTVTIDSKDAAGTITTGVYSTTLSSVVNEIAFPYAGDSAIQIRATLTGTATAEVI